MKISKSVRRVMFSTAAVFLAVGGTVTAAQAEEVRFYNWSDYIDPEVLADFTKETGIKVTYDVFDSNEVLETKLLAGNSGYDLVVPSGSFLSRQITAGVFQKLDRAKLPNWKNLWPEVLKRLEGYDPGNLYSVNYLWGTTGIGYNEAKVKERLPDGPTNSWEMIFKPENAAKLKDCGIFMLDAPEEVIPAAMNYLGLDPNSTNPDDIQKATDLLLSIRPNVQKFHSSEYINALANGDICVALGWSGDVLQARDRADEAKNGQVIKYTIPKEGAQMWFDQMAIPADASNADGAYKLMDYLMRPDVIAKISNYVNYANGNSASKEKVSDEVKNDPSIYPDDATMAKLFVKTTYDQKTQRLVTRAWTKITTGQ